MTEYDLKSLNLPKLYGSMLKVFDAITSSKLTRPLIIGSLVNNGGIPKLRDRVFDEPPTNFPLVLSDEPASAPLEFPQQLSANVRIVHEQLPYNTIGDYVRAYQDGRLTPVQAAEEIIRAISTSGQTNPPLNAFIASSAEDVRAQAAESTARLKSGKARSLLEGVPVAVKDEIDQTPYPTTVGTKFIGSMPAAKDAHVTARLRAAGALLVGKTNMHEIGIATNGENVHYGRIANPYDLQRDTGGSSSGSGAAVAAGIVPAAIGADGGGSIRVPASLNGVVGLKPTFGRVSEAGAAPLCWSVAHIGPLGASVEDVVLIYQIIAGPDPDEAITLQQPPVSVQGWETPHLKGVRVGIYPEWFEHASYEVVAKNRRMLDDFVKAGAQLVEVTIPELDFMRVAHAVTILSEMAACMQNFPQNWKDFAASTRLNLVLGQEMTAHDYIQAQRMRTRALRIFSEVFNEVDVILSPATAMTAPVIPPQALSAGWSDLGTDTEMMRYVYPGNLTGLPAITFPVGYDANGMPVSMQAMGRHWEEHLLLRVAHNAELRVTRQLPRQYFGAEIMK